MDTSVAPASGEEPVEQLPHEELLRRLASDRLPEETRRALLEETARRLQSAPGPRASPDVPWHAGNGGC